MTMPPRFSLLSFPQRYDGERLTVRILVVPRLGPAWNGDPRFPMIEGFPGPGDLAPPFADANLRLRALAIDGLDRFPASRPDTDFAASLRAASGVAPRARGLYEELIAPKAGRFALDPGPPRMAEPVKPQIFIQKYLPGSYRDSFLFTSPRTEDAKTDDSYHCAIRQGQGPNPAFQSSPDTVSWGEIYAFCLRHHELARQLGLIRQASFRVVPPLFAEGGFLYVDLDGGDYEPQAEADFTFLSRYAARIPKLEPGVARPLFASVLFPVLFDDPDLPGPPAAPGNYDAVFLEAAQYDDGFAKVVHGVQPVSQNLLAEEPDGFSPLTDIGIRLGWDDEQLLIWQNRQLKADPTVSPVATEPQRLDAPMGAFAYRIDARKTGTAAWRTLVRVRSRHPLTLGRIPLGPSPSAQFEGELGVEVHPQQLDGDQENGQFWLPAYMTQWNGTSLVLPDEAAAAIFKTEEAVGARAGLGRMYEPVGLDAIPLRYGITYDFRVRLMDPTGGGPRLSDEPIQESPAPIARVPFRRHVVPEPVRVADLPTFPEAPVDSLFTPNTVTVSRPLLNYPAVVFTGKYADPVPRLIAASNTLAGQRSVGIPDPDVVAVHVVVEVGALRMDNKGSASGREPWAVLYSTARSFPANFDQPCTIPLSFRNARVLRFGNPADLGDLGATQDEIDALQELILPTARDIRLTLRAVADGDTTYFANGAHVGKPVQLRVRRESSDEADLFADTTPGQMIRGIYLQPDPVPVNTGAIGDLAFVNSTGGTPSIAQRLAQQLGVDNKGLTLVGRRGERVIFGCSRSLRHTLAPDGSSVTFASKDDLVNHWIVGMTLQLDRDWTWNAVGQVGFEIFRTKKFESDVEVDDNNGQPVGDWEMARTVSLQALDGPMRDYTRLIFLDAVEPKSSSPQAADPSQTRFPDILQLDYRVEPRFRSAPPPIADAPEAVHLELPVTTPPAQVPQIASAGLALSAYRRNDRYSATEPRRRFLWLELSEPVRDPHDGYFLRLLGYAPDPLLSDGRPETLVPPEESPLPIDPELVRVISPGQSDDGAGLGAMQPMVRAGNSNRHFLVPLPPGLVADSPELFGFFTYELRVGHQGIWSTAQGRFGRPLRVTGVQHPAPTLFCTCHRDPDTLVVEAPHAKAVLNGKDVTAKPPRSEIWALLYAQVRQADGKDYRNVLLDDRALELRRIPATTTIGSARMRLSSLATAELSDKATTHWTSEEIVGMLARLGLPVDSPLSVLCVEMLPAVTNMRHGQMQSVNVDIDVPAAIRSARSGSGRGGFREPSSKSSPLSDNLGHFRILRTSPLTEVPPVC